MSRFEPLLRAKYRCLLSPDSFPAPPSSRGRICSARNCDLVKMRRSASLMRADGWVTTRGYAHTSYSTGTNFRSPSQLPCNCLRNCDPCHTFTDLVWVYEQRCNLSRRRAPHRDVLNVIDQDGTAGNLRTVSYTALVGSGTILWKRIRQALMVGRPF
jgi:hypothetical protein